jgi:hypothetical protein
MKQAILYSVPDCPRCHQLAVWLMAHGIVFQNRNLANPAVLTDLRLDCCFEIQAPILKVGCMYYPAGFMFEGERLQEEKVKKMMEEA